LIKDVFRKATAEMSQQLSLVLQPKTGTFTIPEQDLFRYDSAETDVIEYLSNAYKGYSSQMVADGIRSMPERKNLRLAAIRPGIT
jgi:type III restriction enzyme